MKTAAKRISVLFFLIPFMLCLSGRVVFGADIAQPVYDFADLLTKEEEDALSQDIAALVEETGLAYVFLTTHSTDGKTPEAYADDFYDEHDFGLDEAGSGILLLIDMGNRQIWFSTKGRAIDIFTDARIDVMYNSVKDCMRSEDYAAAANSFLERAKAYAEAGVPDNAYREDEDGTIIQKDEEEGAVRHEEPNRLEPTELFIAVVVPLVAGGLVFLIVFLNYNRTSKPYPYPFQQQSKMQLTASQDQFIRRTVTTRHIDASSHSGGGGGRSSTHRSSSGSTHGGGGGGF